MFDYRIAYGCWLNDSRREPIADEPWPSVRIDDATLHSLDGTLRFLGEAGYNCFDVFGLVTNLSWETDIISTVTEHRKALVRKVIDIVHRHGLKLIYGLGVYSWGFDRIIAQNPDVRGTNPHVMCASSPASESLMRQVIDYIAGTFDIDGFHLEAADQGRCGCERCQGIRDDIGYYNRINVLTASYIRTRWPGKILLVNTSGYLPWGDTFDGAQLRQMEELCAAVDVFIDVGSHGAFVPEKDRREFAGRIGASFGTANGFWVYPPQRWERLRWLIPHFQQNRAHLKKLHDDGGRSCELYLSPVVNPGAEITLLCNGLFLSDPGASADAILAEAVGRLYRPASDRQKAAVTEILKEAEDLFFSCYHPVRNRSLEDRYSDGVEQVFDWSRQHPDKAVPGELFLERLFGEDTGFPCYLALHFDTEGRERYRLGMEGLLGKISRAQSYGNSEKIHRLAVCAENVLKDIRTASAALG